MRSAVFHEPRTSLTVENADDPSPADGQLMRSSAEDKWPIIESSPGVEIISKPKLTEYPGYGGKGKISGLDSEFNDADGYIPEANQVLSD